jgi:hypothetical protein
MPRRNPEEIEGKRATVDSILKLWENLKCYASD